LARRSDFFFKAQQVKKIIKMKALATCIVPPQFILSTPLHVVPLSNATLQNTTNKDIQCKKQTTIIDERMENSKLKWESTLKQTFKNQSSTLELVPCKKTLDLLPLELLPFPI
jgi:hypothetical protein